LPNLLACTLIPLISISGAGCCFPQSALGLLERMHVLVTRQQQFIQLRLKFAELQPLMLLCFCGIRLGLFKQGALQS
jgi:hypothetical protein